MPHFCATLIQGSITLAADLAVAHRLQAFQH